MKYGRDTPITTPPMISRNPNPYPKVIPATHIDGLEGSSKDGNNATEAKIKIASNGVLNVVLSQLIIGIIVCKRTSNQSVPAGKEKKRICNLSSDG